jgi:hypothetical protein
MTQGRVFRWFPKWCFVAILMAASLLQPLAPVMAEPPIVARLSSWVKGQGRPPVTHEDKAIENLAANLDWLESHLNQWGSVTAKAPDVWGEARLTQYRLEVERELAKRVTEFDMYRLHGAETISDSAFLAAAFAMKGNLPAPGASSSSISPPNVTAESAKVAAEAPAVEIKQSVTVPQSLLLQNGSNFYKLFGSDSTIKLEQNLVLDNLNNYLQHLNQLRRINEGDDTSDAPGYSMNLLRVPVSILPGTLSKQGYGAEITLTASSYLGTELLPMTYRDMVSNDLADQLAISLTRFFNSQPNRTDKVMNAVRIYFETPDRLKRFNEEYLGKPLPFTPDILAVIRQNHQLDFFANGILNREIHNRPDVLRAVQYEIELIVDMIQQDLDATFLASASFEPRGQRSLPRLTASHLQAPTPGTPAVSKPATIPQIEARYGAKLPNSRQLLESIKKRSAEIQQLSPPDSPPDSSPRASSVPKPEVPSSSSDLKSLDEQQKGELFPQIRSEIDQFVVSKFEISEIFEPIIEANNALRVLSSVSTISFGASANRRAQMSIPPAQLVDVFGDTNLAQLAVEMWQGFREDLPNKRVVNVMDAKGYLREEIGAAIELLYADAMRGWWAREASGERPLYNLIRMRDSQAQTAYREEFLESISGHGRSVSTPALAWCVFVESILLNERLVDDIRETSGNRPCGCVMPGWLAFFGPDPSSEARQAFSEYVRCRWPIRVFALDPAIDQQSIAEQSNIYRQMQLAVALGFAGGDVGLSTAIDALRKLQRDRATIDLNRTAVAFGHGEDTFGWRFQPRFQVPAVEGNARVLFRDLIVGGPTDRQLERGYEIEPGMRECTAIVLMPSFVPFVTLEARGNWFKLVRPGRTGTSIQDDVHMSRAIKQMQNQAIECVRCSHLYRHGQVDRLLARVKQLEQRLPLQSLACQVPIENTYGGFEVFGGGTRALAPELQGWHGSPGYDPTKGGEFFLDGDGFSVKQTHIIAGNAKIPATDFDLISRQLIRVKLPPRLPILPDTFLQAHDPYQQTARETAKIFNDRKFDGYLDVHVATPYGASSHLLIPVVQQESKSEINPSAPALSVPTEPVKGFILRQHQSTRIIFQSVQLTPPVLPAVLLTNQVGLARQPRPLRLYLKRGPDRLSPILFKETLLGADGSSLVVPMDSLIKSLQDKAALREQIELYVRYLDSLGALPTDTLVLTGSYTVGFENAEIPVQGEFPIQLTIVNNL